MDLVEFFKYGASLPANYVADGVLFLRAQNIREYGIDLSDIRYISRDIPKLERYRLEAGDVLITRSGINVGNAAFISAELAGSIHGSYSIRLHLGTKEVSPEYLAIILNSPLLKPQIAAFKGRSAQPNINIAELSALQIPLPPRLIQDHIAQVMQDAYATQREKLAAAESLLGGIDKNVLGRLGINLGDHSSKKYFLVTSSQIVGRRFDIGPYANEFNLPEDTPFPWVNLYELAQLPSEAKIASKTPNATHIYIGMSDVDDTTAEVNIQQLQGQEIKANKTVFKGNDVVFARIEPCIYNRKIALIPSEIKEALGSTELLVARARQEVLPEFLLWILRSELTQRQITGKMTGTTGRRRLPNIEFAHLKIPKIPIELQREIAEEATRQRDEAKRLRAEAEAVVAEAKARVERLILGEVA